MLIDDEQQAREGVPIYIVGTGNEFPESPSNLDFLGRVNDGPFVWHIFWFARPF